MDGNGRWAKSQGLSRSEGHQKGLETVKRVISLCLKEKIPVLSLFAFSSENWRRPEMEVLGLMELFFKALEKESEVLHEKGVKLCFIGSREALSKALQEKMLKAEALTAANNKLALNILMNYGGRWDIVQATKNIVQEVLNGTLVKDDINEDLFSQFLGTKNTIEPDLFIRTSGEERISNFLLWQLAYTELYFSEVYWPSFSEEEFYKALLDFEKRERRYGHAEAQGDCHV